MIWIIVVVVMCPIAVLAQLVLGYKKRAHVLRMKQEPLRFRIGKHNDALHEMVRTSEEAAMPRIEELQGVIREFTKFIDEHKPLLATLEGEGRDSGLLVEEEEDSLLDDGKPDMTLDLEKEEEEEDVELDLAATFRDTQSCQDKLDLHLGDLGRDLDIVTRTLSRIRDRAKVGNTGSETMAKTRPTR